MRYREVGIEVEMIIALQVSGHLNAYAYDNIVVDGTVKTLAAGKIENTADFKDLGKAKLIRISVEEQTMRFREDNLADPSLTEGHLLSPGDWYYIANLQQMKNFKFTRATGTSGRIFVTYFR